VATEAEVLEYLRGDIEPVQGTPEVVDPNTPEVTQEPEVMEFMRDEVAKPQQPKQPFNNGDFVPTPENMEVDTNPERTPPRSFADYLQNVGHAAVKSVGDMLNFPSFVLNTASNSVNELGERAGFQEAEDWRGTGRESPLPTATSGLNMLTGGYFDQANERSIPKGENALADFTHTATEWGLPIGKGQTATTLVADTLRSMDNITDAGLAATQVTKTAGDIGKAYKPEIVIGSFAGAGGAIDDANSQTGEMTGGLVSIVGQIAADFKKGRGLNSRTATELNRALATIGHNASESDAELIAKIQKAIAEGDVGTLATLSKDRGLYNLEARQGKTNAKLQEQMDELDLQYNDRTNESAMSHAGTTPEELSGLVKPRVDDINQRIINTAKTAVTKADDQATQQTAFIDADVTAKTDADTLAQQNLADAEAAGQTARADEAQAAVTADQKLEAVSTPRTVAEISADLNEKTAAARKTAKIPVTKAWEDFTGGGLLNTESVTAKTKERLEGLSRTNKVILDREFGVGVELVKGLFKNPKGLNPEDVSAVISKLKQDMKNTEHLKTSTGHGRKLLGDLLRDLETGLKAQGTGALYEVARNKSNEFFQRYINPRLQSELSTSKGFEGESLGGLLAGDKGYTTGIELQELAKGVPEAKGLIEEALQATANGAFKGDMAAKFMVEHEDLLKRYPSLKTKLTELLDANKNVADTAKTAKNAASAEKTALTKATTASKEKIASTEPARKQRVDTALTTAKATAASKKAKNQKTLQKTIAGQVVYQPNKVLDRLLDPNLDHAVEKIKKVLDQVRKLPNGIEKVKQATVDRFVNKNMTWDKDGKGINPNAHSDFMKVSPKLVEAGVFTQKEADEFATVLDRAYSRSRRLEGKGAKVFNADMSNFDKLVASAVGSSLAKHIPVGSALVMTGVLRRIVSGQMDYIGRETARSKELVDKIILNPEILINPEILKGVDSEFAAMEAFKKLLNSKKESNALRRAGAATRAGEEYNSEETK
jgi:hypothetical protein